MHAIIITLLILLASVQQVHAIPVVFAIGASVAGMSAATALGFAAFTATQIIGMALINGVLAGASMLLQKKPAMGDFSTEAASQTIMAKDPVSPRQLVYGNTKISGTVVFLHKTGTKGEFIHMILAVAGHKISSVDEIYFEDELVEIDEDGNGTGKWEDFLRIKTHLGDDDQTADTDLIAEAGNNEDDEPIWTTDHRLRGIAYLYIRFKYSNDLYPNGIPNVSVIVKGKPVYDPRTEATAYSCNPVLCNRDYLVDSRLGLNVATAAINVSSFNEAANACDEDIALADGGTEKLFEAHGVVDMSMTPEDILGRLRSSFGAICYPCGGVWYCRAGIWRTPTMATLTDSDCRDFPTVQVAVSRRELFNAINGIYVSPINNWQAATYPVVKSDSYATLDGEVIYRDFPLAFTKSPTMAQRLAKQELLKVRQPITCVYKGNLSALQFMVGDNVPVTLSQMGWANKYFEVTDVRIVGDTDSAGNPLIGVDLTLRETASSIFDWSTDEESLIDTAPNTNLPSPYDVPAPTNLQVFSGNDELYIKGDGTVFTRARLTWDLALWASVQSGGGYEIEYKQSSSPDWIEIGKVKGNLSEYFIPDVEDGVQYDFRIRSRSVANIPSPWATVTNYLIIGKTEPPTPPSNFLVSRQSDGTRQFSWDPPTDILDFYGCEIRYSTDLDAAWEDMELLHMGVLLASPYETNSLSAGTYKFSIKSIDTTGNYSTDSVDITTELLNPRIAAALDVLYPAQNGWAGTITNGQVADNNTVEGVSSLTWDDLTTWTAFTSWLQDAVTPLVYEESYDAGAVISFTPRITATVIGTATYEISYSVDGVSWSAWQSPLNAITARYLKYRVSVDGPGPVIQSIVVIIDAFPVVQEVNDLVTSTVASPAGDFRVALTKTFVRINSVSVTLQNTGPGWSWELIDKNTTLGPRIKIYNSSNALADATVDVTIKGV